VPPLLGCCCSGGGGGGLCSGVALVLADEGPAVLLPLLLLPTSGVGGAVARARTPNGTRRSAPSDARSGVKAAMARVVR
jgi:hypothetical protein